MLINYDNVMFLDADDVGFIRKKLSHDVGPVSDITSCNKNDKPLVVYRFW